MDEYVTWVMRVITLGSLLTIVYTIRTRLAAYLIILTELKIQMNQDFTLRRRYEVTAELWVRDITQKLDRNYEAIQKRNDTTVN